MLITIIYILYRIPTVLKLCAWQMADAAFKRYVLMLVRNGTKYAIVVTPISILAITRKTGYFNYDSNFDSQL